MAGTGGSTLAIILLTIVFFITGPFTSLFIIGYVFFYTAYYPWVVVYILWCLYDRNSKTRIQRRSPWFRSHKMWNYFRDYYPNQLVKTAELDPSHNYVVGLHPHGILVAGGLNFATEAGGFSKKYPGIKPYVLVHEFLLMLSFMREIAIPLGFTSVAKASFEYLLQERDGGNMIVLVPGGVKEMIATKPGDTVDLFLKNRKGFVREALRNGASLVPAFTFGEHELYKVNEFTPGGFLAKLQKAVSQYLHLPLMNATGRFAFLPMKKPVTTVVGSPIHLERNLSPTKQDVDELHSRYVAELTELFENHKEKYGGKNQSLRFL